MQKNSLVLVIQSRFGSSRFRGKAVKNLAGKPLLARIIQRVKRVKKIKKIIIATTTKKEDDVIVKVAKDNKVQFYRGSENNLVDRYYKAVKDMKVKNILRLPGDNAIPEPSEYNRIINYHLKSKNDFSSNIYNFMGNGYPGGIGVEIFTLKSLKKVWKSKKTKMEKEHLALNYFHYVNGKRNKKFNFKIGTVKCPKKISRPDLKLDINTQKEYLFIKKIYKYFMPKKNLFTIKDVINWYDKIYFKKRRVTK